MYPEIHGPRVILRQLEQHEAESVFALVDANRERLRIWLPWVDETTRPEHSLTFITSLKQQRTRKETYGYGIIVDGSIAGHASLMHISDDQPPEIGYWVDRHHTGQGVATETVRILTTLGLQQLQLPAIIIRADSQNTASNRVAEKAGYRLHDTSSEDGHTIHIWRITRQQNEL
jgi:ribosomal-protein-serine acetyltransferase